MTNTQPQIKTEEAAVTETVVTTPEVAVVAPIAPEAANDSVAATTEAK